MLKALTTDQNRIPEGVLLRDLDFEEPFYEGLIYNPPARGVWNIVHTGMLIPESHQIYVCAQGCLRGVVLTAAEMNRMDLIVVKQMSASFFNDIERVRKYFKGKIKFYESTVEDLVELDKQICYELVQERKVFRDEYCQMHGIPTTDVIQRLKASKYIRERTTPVLIVFEKFIELFNLLKDEQIVSGDYQRIFERTQGYNFYFLGGFTSEDELIADTAILKSFNKDEFSLLFGGRYDKQQAIASLPTDIRRKTDEEKDYRKFILKYQNGYYSMRMPSGVLKAKDTDPDDEPII